MAAELSHQPPSAWLGPKLDADRAPAQVPGDTAEARIAGKLRLLQRLVDGAPKQLAGAEGDAPEPNQAQVCCIGIL